MMRCKNCHSSKSIFSTFIYFFANSGLLRQGSQQSQSILTYIFGFSGVETVGNDTQFVNFGYFVIFKHPQWRSLNRKLQMIPTWTPDTFSEFQPQHYIYQILSIRLIYLVLLRYKECFSRHGRPVILFQSSDVLLVFPLVMK